MKKTLLISILASFVFISMPFGNVDAKTAKEAKKTAKVQTVKKPAATKKTAPKVIWSASGTRELRKVPAFARPYMKKKIEAYAIEHGIKVITAEIYNEIHV